MPLSPNSRPGGVSPNLAYLGSSGTDSAKGIKTDSQGNLIVVGSTGSTNFPLLFPFQPSFGGGGLDGFITKLNAAGTALMLSTYLGGSGAEVPSAVAIGTSDRIYLTGYTQSANFPLKGWTGTLQGAQDAFVSRLTATGSLQFSMFFGGMQNDIGRGIAVQGTDLYVSGDTSNTDYPVLNALQASSGGGTDAFLTKFGSCTIRKT